MDQDTLLAAINNLKNGDLSAQIQAARDLGNAAGDERTNISEAADALIECLSSEDESLRASSVMALYNATATGINLAGKVAKFKKIINDECFGVRFYGIPLMAELANSGVDISEAMPELINQMVAEQDSQIKTNLALTFCYMAEKNMDISTAIPILVTAMSIPGFSIMLYRNASDAIVAFLRQKPDQKDFVQVIVDNSSINKKDENVQDLLEALK